MSNLSSIQEENELLHRIVETVTYTVDLDDTLRQIINIVDSIAQADEIFIYTVGDKRVRMRAAKNEAPETVGSPEMTIGEGITGWVAKEQKPVVLSKQAFADERFLAFSTLQADKYEAFFSLPMMYQKRCIGVLNVQYRKPHKFTQREQQLLRTIASATAGAIENAELMEQNVVLSQRIEQRKLIEKAKGKLMKHHQWNEEQAYQWLKKRAMDVRKPMHEVAEAVLISL